MITIKEYKSLLNKNKSFIKVKKKIKKIEEEIKLNFSIEEVKLLTSVSKRKLDDIDPEKLVNYLVNTTANRERLVEVTNMLILHRNEINSILLKVKSKLEQESFFISLKRQDRKLYSDAILLEFNLKLNKLDSYLDIVEVSTNHLDKVQFNIKTIISYKKNGNTK